MVLMAVGRVPNTQGLNAEGIGIEFDRKAIRTDAHMRTNIPHIYAIGDVNGKVMLAHTASHEGMVAVADICGQGEEMRYDRIPSCVYLEGKRYNCDLSASCNIGARYFIRELLKPLSATERSLLEAKVPSVKRRTSCVYADLRKLHSEMERLKAA